MVRRFDSPRRKVYYIQAGEDLDQALDSFLKSDSTEIEGFTDGTRINLDRSTVEKGLSAGLNSLKTAFEVFTSERNENKSSQE